MKITLKNQEIELTDEQCQQIIETYKVKSGRWKPVYDELYWTIDEDGWILESAWWDNAVDMFAFKNNNCFKTEAEAQAHLDWINAKATIEEDAEYWTPDWSDYTQVKYSGAYDYYSKSLSNGFDTCNDYGNINFQSEEKLKQSQTEHPDAWMTYLKIGEK